MSNKSLLIIGLFLFTTLSPKAQHKPEGFSTMFYNLENFFDTKDDTLTSDENYTPEGELHWTFNRFEQKKQNISKVIMAAGGWKMPDLIVFCEIENRYVIDKLLTDTPLKKTPYRVIHKDSPDHRGIDVAMIYNSESFYPLDYKYYPLEYKKGKVATREILYVTGVVNGTDTLHIFGNHWPSRYSGVLETQTLRVAAASLLKGKIDELFRLFADPNIIIIGDFNENPSEGAIASVLHAEMPGETIENERLYNLSADWVKPNNGTLKYQSQWFVFDQIIVSGTLLLPERNLHTKASEASIVNLPFLLEDDKKFGGKKPFRTYNGFHYQGGFSDHLPVLLKITTSE
jgi:endonuclease/exonuclease/phosphatase family metal-dependent hydrolase